MSKKHINHTIRLLSSAGISNFSPGINNFCYIKKYKDCFNKHGCSFDDVSKIGYSSPS